jgi:mannose-6-phosphate isomerase-like protein (cupin superfamily)
VVTATARFTRASYRTLAPNGRATYDDLHPFTEESPMEQRKLGNVANHFLFENERVRVWEMLLEPGEASDFHQHELPYLLCILEGDNIDADYEDGRSLNFPLKPGQVVYVEPGNRETAVNRSSVRFREILIELKAVP